MTTTRYRRLPKVAPETPSVVLSLRLPQALAEQIRARAQRERRSLNSMVIYLLAKALEAEAYKESR